MCGSSVARVLLHQSTEMIRELRCGDVFEGCSYVEQGSDIRELMVKFTAHLREVHHVDSLTPELRIQAMVAVRQARPNGD
jgi:predicted small metal-binding protein